MDTEKNIKFKRNAERRMSRIFVTMNTINKLTRQQQYAYTQAEVDDLFTQYQEKGREVRKYFDAPKTLWNEVQPEFRFNPEILAKAQTQMALAEVERVKEAKNSPANAKRSSANIITKHDRFVDLATARMSKVFADMRLIANLSNKSNYSYSTEEVDYMFAAYAEKGRVVAERFETLKEEFTF